MIPLRLDEIAAVLGTELVGVSSADLQPDGVVRIDSRDVDPGDVFACVRGGELDGHDFIDEAIGRGAVLAIASRPVSGPQVVVPDVVGALGLLARAVIDRRPRVVVIGITGSSGKTSTKDLLAQVLEAAAPTVSPPGSFNNELGLPLTVLRTVDDTRFLVLEMGARGAGHIRDLCAVAPPRIGVVVNVGSAHLGQFGDRAAVARAKGELIEALPSTGTAVLNADDPYVAAMAALTPADVLTFGLQPDADIHAANVELDPAGHASFLLVTRDGVAPVSLQVVGAHHVSNALAAAAVATAVGIPLAGVAIALSDALPRSPWRMDVSETASGVTVVNDAYNANPESMRAGLEALVAIGQGRRTWAVLGEMRELGDSSLAAHVAVGRFAVSLGIDRIVVVGEGARAMQAGALAAGADPTSVLFVDDPVAAIEVLGSALAERDVVLVKASRSVGLEVVVDALGSRATEEAR